LTASVADGARLLLQGLEPGHIAEERRTSQHTVRNQIASVYAKSGARNRSDLVRLIVRVLPPVS
jgi:DNA-binding NarL/FixJ family response regulator